jgi:hypothetical protein
MLGFKPEPFENSSRGKNLSNNNDNNPRATITPGYIAALSPNWMAHSEYRPL